MHLVRITENMRYPTFMGGVGDDPVYVRQSLRPDIWEWLEDRRVKYDVIRFPDVEQMIAVNCEWVMWRFYLRFERASDAMLFKMVWTE